MLKCKEVVEKADALVDGMPLSWRERLAMRLHLIMCHHCRRYIWQLNALVTSLPHEPQPLDDEQTKRILKKIDSPGN